MIVHTFPPEPFGGVSVGASIERGWFVNVSCADHRWPHGLDLSPDGPFAAHKARTWPEVFPALRCGQCGKPAIRLTLCARDNLGDVLFPLRISDDDHPFPDPGQKHVVGSGASARHRALVAGGVLRS